MFDARQRKYLMAHTMLPRYDDYYRHHPDESPARFTDLAVLNMIKHLKNRGSSVRDIKVRIVGGAQILHDEMEIGIRNIKAAHEILHQEGVEIVAEDIGGNIGRSIEKFFPDGSVLVKKAGKKFQL